MLSRRRFLAALGLGLASCRLYADMPIPGLRASPSGAVVVEIINFWCPRCRRVNEYYDQLHAVSVAAGSPLRIAPVTWEGQATWPNRVYYAVRDLYPEVEGLLRNMLFDGCQQEGMLFENLAQVMSYLELRQIPRLAQQRHISLDLLAIADRATSAEPAISEFKANRLLNLSGADAVPAFVWVREGEVSETISPADAPEPGALARLVIRKLAEPPHG